jgi:ABC-type transport system involved in cytochrome bd biosynthesis fused ATPase/permease subunit
MTDLHQQIADLEADIEALSDEAERCRKGMIVAKAAVVGGLLVFGATLFGLIRSDPIALLAGITATLAGVVFYGSSRSTREQITAKINRHEARRAELIDGMDLWTVPKR